MGNEASREGRLDSDSDSDDDGGPDSPQGSERSFQSTGSGTPAYRDRSPSPNADPTLDMKLGSLSLQESSAVMNAQKAKLYRYSEGQWVTAAKHVSWQFEREGDVDDADEEDEKWRSSTAGLKDYDFWMFVVGNVRARVDDRLQMHFYDDQFRVDFVAKGVWALKFSSKEQYVECIKDYEDSKFENTYLLKPTEANKVKVFGKDFMGWANGEGGDESIWEDAEEALEPPPTPSKALKQTFKTPSKVKVQSLTMGGLDHSYLVNDCGLDVLSNQASGLEGKNISIHFQDGGKAGGGSSPFVTPKKGMLIRGETNMMLFSPSKDGKSNAGGVSQLDIGTGKMVADWKFEKDGAPITMKDVTNESKGAQLYSGGFTFLGLDDNRLCRWDMRDPNGVVQQLASPATLNWSEGHQFSRGTNFNCFATAGDGSIVVGSNDGKVRLYGTTSMRMAKTAFPGLGSPITHVDVTYDGKWVLATTDTYLMLISTVFKDKDGKAKTGFSGRMGSKTAAPRLLKLLPVDSCRDGKQQNLHGGKFSWVTEEGKQERNLVVSAGTFTVIWNFAIVKDSNHNCYKQQRVDSLKSCYCYKVVPKAESIVQSTFMHDRFHESIEEAPLVVATPYDVSSFNIDLEESSSI